MKKRMLKELPELLVTPVIRDAEGKDVPTARNNGCSAKKRLLSM